MKKVTGLLAVVAFALVAAGCAPSVKMFKADDELRHSTLKECAAKGLKAKDDQSCVNATKAQAEVAGDSVKDLFK